MRTNVWIDLHTGGIICKTGRNSFLARPEGAGMSKIRWFPTQVRAVQYAAGEPGRVLT